MEMARQMSLIYEQSGIPERTVKFCTCVGEEEGLWGSRAYVEEMQSSLREYLRLYLNFDKNHVDSDFENRGNYLTLFTNDEDDYGHIKLCRIIQDRRSEVAQKYDIRFSLLDGDQGESDEMPYDSRPLPFCLTLAEKGKKRVSCYGNGSWEYHTYLDTMDRFHEESLAVSGTIYGTYEITRLRFECVNEGLKT